MGNWLNYKFFLLLFSLTILASIGEYQLTQNKWGFFGHKRINRIATFTLPPEMFGFYKEHLEYITEHAVDPDKRRYAVDGEAQRHYIDIDHYAKHGENPFDLVPRKWNDAVDQLSEDTLQAYGIVPWHISVMKFRLQRAFEQKNVDLILKYSSDIGHYIGDAHVPLHTTENYNGQLTNQKGIHGLWESRLVEINVENYDYFVGKAKYIKHIGNHIWDAVETSHMAVDSVLQLEKDVTNDFASDRKYSFERRGNVTTAVYSHDFSQEYHRRMNGMVERRLRAAIACVGSMWYTAWVDAGQPDLSNLQNTPPSAALIEEMKTLDLHYHNSPHKGRICE
ncbi:MAG: zinc dependent phospholipase C family protein [Crocinitomicaceae bacterium]|nr:zinc dependent phospholipase C family protein [Crocinitomicaceae bacterium]MDG1776815.1 zinc dependent phospholipase C family protein [Crocinitomicaceae bacterium]